KIPRVKPKGYSCQSSVPSGIYQSKLLCCLWWFPNQMDRHARLWTRKDGTDRLVMFKRKSKVFPRSINSMRRALALLFIY
ncbi:MAG: hypothetical protein DSY53_02460, partial [Persephonella sp.]